MVLIYSIFYCFKILLRSFILAKNRYVFKICIFRIRPGTQHQKLKQELEDKIAEQRSLEWAKRLEDEKQKQAELKEIRGETSDIEEDNLEKYEAKLDEECNIDEKDDAESEEEEDLIEDDIDMTDKKKKHNPLIEDEAVESDVEENNENDGEVIDDNHSLNENQTEDENSTESDSSDESEDENQNNSITKKSRILRAFEDSDDEDFRKEENTSTEKVSNEDIQTHDIGIMDMMSEG